MSDQDYCGLAWKAGGRDRSGVDCAGLAALWLKEELGFDVMPPESREWTNDWTMPVFSGDITSRGRIVFFEDLKRGGIRHVAVSIGDGKLLHILQGCESRVDNGVVLLRRLGFRPVGSLGKEQIGDLVVALAQPKLGEAGTIVLLVVAVALSAASYFLTPKPGAISRKGIYGPDALLTDISTEIPLPDLLGEVVVAGNAVYTTLPDKSLATAEPQKSNKVIVIGSAPIVGIDEGTADIKINGLIYDDEFFRADVGIYLNPGQTETEAVDGTIIGKTNVPSATIYNGDHDITVPVDVRASWDRSFPVYGFSGMAYVVFRLINSTKFSNFNVTLKVQGRRCRAFNASGFILTTVSGESLAGADGSKVRFKLAFGDVNEVTALTVNGSSFAEATEGQQNGDVYRVNYLKGYIEFFTAPPGSATISITYSYYPREWTQNPAMQIVYLLTEEGRGKGFEETKIDWPSAVALRDYCDVLLPWVSSDGLTGSKRYTSNYSVDFRKPAQDHIRAILDACYGYLFLSGGKLGLKARASQTSVFSFNSTNILADGFTYEQIKRTDRATRVHAFFRSRESHNSETEVVRDDLVAQRERADVVGNDGVIPETFKLEAVDGLGQAERFAEQVLRERVNMRWIGELRTNLKGLALEVGDVVDVTFGVWTAKEWRIESIQHDESDQIQLSLSEYYEPSYI